MKRFIINLTSFFLILAISDLCIGKVFNLMDLSKGGEIHKLHTIMTKITPDMIILGSSRASHHYVSSIIGDSLNLSVYNAGIDGQGTTIAYGLLKAIGKRDYPKYIVCEITPNYDLYEGTSSMALNMFYPYVYQEKDIWNLVTDFDPDEKWKLISNAYRFNSIIFRLIPSIFLNRQSFIKGYQPLYGYKKEDNSSEDDTMAKMKIDSMKEKYLREFIEDARANNCQIVFTISPVYQGGDVSFYKKEIDIIREYGIPIINRLNDKRIVNNRYFFQDNLHMNNRGATEYSKTIIEDLKIQLDLKE